MPGFMVTFDTDDVHRQLKALLDGGKALLKEPQTLFSINAKKAAEILLQLQPRLIAQVVDEYRKRGGEHAEEVISEYWWMIALAYGMAGKTTEGRGYVDKAKNLRRGGIFSEWCQTYYKSL